MEPQEQTPTRPRRFAVSLPVWYRTTGDSGWHAGTTESVSSSGAAIRTREPIVAGTKVRVRIELPTPSPWPGAYLTGTGEVVRTIERSTIAPSIFAIAVKRYRLERRTNPHDPATR